MKVVFLGGGYLGYNLSVLLKEKYDVELWGIDSPYTSLSDSFHKVNAFDSEAMKQMALEDAIIVDTVSLVSNDAKSEDEDTILENVKEKYQTLFSVLKEGKVKRFVFFSSGGTVYGKSNAKAKEDDALLPMSLYAKSKVMLENLLKESGLDYLILRLSNPYGGYQLAGKRQGVVPILVRSSLLEEPFHLWTKEDSIRDYFYIDDLANAIHLLIQNDIHHEIVNVGSGKGTSLKEVIDIVESETNKKIQIVHENSDVLIVDSIILDIHKLETLTGYTAKVSLKEGIQQEIQRIKEEIQ